MRKSMILAAALLASTPVSASITYDFVGINGDVSFTVDTFLTGFGPIPPADIDSCSDSIACVVNFNANVIGEDLLSVTFSSDGTIELGRFQDGAVATLGTNVSTRGPQTLTVRDNSAVPEPATWATMLLGFGAVGFAMRRRKRVTCELPRTA